MQLLDLKSQQKRIESDLKRRIEKVMNHSRFILGPETEELEIKLAELSERKYSLTVSNGSLAIMMALMALDLKPGAEIITTSFSFIATAEMPELLGFKLKFADIDPISFNIDPKSAESLITENTGAIIAVDLYGQCADYKALEKICQKQSIPIISDAAQSFGANQSGKPAGSFGKIATTSFFPSKPLGCFGDGGAVFTDDDQIFEKLKMIRNHGQKDRYIHGILGLNGRMDTLQAAILLAKLEIFGGEIHRRREIALFYENELKGANITTPETSTEDKSAWAQYTIRSAKREQLQEHLKSAEIPSAIHYPMPLHKQPVFNQSDRSLPEVEKASKEVLSIPMHPYLSSADIKQVVKQILSFKD